MANHFVYRNLLFARYSCRSSQRINPSKVCCSRLKTTSAATKISLENGDGPGNSAERAQEVTNNNSPSHASVLGLDGTANTMESPPASVSGDIRAGLGRLDLVFGDCKEAYRSKTTVEVARAFLVFKLCQLNFLVTHNKEIMKFSRKILGKRLFELAMDATFYGHFVAGRDQASIKPTIDRLAQFGVGSILDYSVEEDMPHSEAVEAEMESCVSHAETEKEETHLKQFKAYREFADRRTDVESARTYFYEDEEKCDDNLKTLLDCVDVAGATSSDGFAAVKFTALGRPQMLLNLSEVLVRTRHVFVQMAHANSALIDLQLTKEQFQSELEALGLTSRDDTNEWFTWMDFDKDGRIDLLDWDRLMEPEIKLTKIFKVPQIQRGHLEPLQLSLTEEEESQMKRMLSRINTLAKRARDKGVRLMIDAEQSYFQPAINRLAMELMRKFNKERPIIFNTYQCYLKQTFNNLNIDIELAHREGFHFGAKLVRGAYMDQERKRAKEIGYEDPINPDYEATSAMYHRCLDFVLQTIQSRGKVNIMVASHNEKTIRFAVERMEELNIKPEDRLVYFGQLLGMCDQVSFPLGQGGYAVYKYVPYGPVEDVLPYLSRRALENRGMLKGVKKERRLLWQELTRRIRHGQVLYSPTHA
ncbi:proline dehydrogenase 1, mitochondrial-like [Patiria miniata]|uniref:Proline dehydrogenase n=1 Tax=Patiria miniata TaxID=46514 RepID=A0A914A6W9_PATMI|nr:proline dehydrogenase 1, mitochondrial-like [Patiria miniata]